MKRQLSGVVVAAYLIGASACAHARHVAVVGDITFASSVAAIDDAEWKACHPPNLDTSAGLSSAKCAELNPKIKQLLLDVKATTQAIKDTPKDATVPKTIPAILAGLASVQRIIWDLSPGPVKSDLTAKVSASLDQVIAFLTKFTGGA